MEDNITKTLEFALTLLVYTMGMMFFESTVFGLFQDTYSAKESGIIILKMLFLSSLIFYIKIKKG
jgi:hypothetical protein